MNANGALCGGPEVCEKCANDAVEQTRSMAEDMLPAYVGLSWWEARRFDMTRDDSGKP